MENFRSKGGNMHLIATDPTLGPVEDVVRRTNAMALYLHGERTDVLFREGKMDEAQEYTKRVRQAGVRVGIGTHKPEVVEYVEEHGWDVDFYMLCVYNRTRTPEEYSQAAGCAARCPPRTSILKPILPAPTRWRARLPRPASCSRFSPPAAS